MKWPALAALAIGLPLLAQTTTAQPAANAPTAASAASAAAPAPNPFPNAIPAIQVIGQADATLAAYPSSVGGGAEADDTDRAESDVREEMESRQGDLQLFADATSTALAQNPSLDTIRALETHGNYLATFPAAWNASLAGQAARLQQRLDRMGVDEKKWHDTLGALKAATPPAPPSLLQRAAEVVKQLAAARTAMTAQQSALVDLESAVNRQANLVGGALNQLATARTRAVSQLFERNAPPVWAGGPMPDQDLTTQPSWRRQGHYLAKFVSAQAGKIVLHGLLLVLLVGAFYWLRGFARTVTVQEPEVAQAARIFEMPVAAGLLLALFASYALYYPAAPRLLFALAGAMALAPSVILLRHVVERRMFPLLYALVAFFFVEEYRSVAAFTPTGARAFLLAEYLAAFVFLAWLLLSLRRAPPARRIGRPIRWAGWLAFAALAGGWLAAALGYTLLAGQICAGVQHTATLGLALYAGMRIVEALLFILTRLQPLAGLGMIRRHRTLVLRRAQALLTWAALITWALLTVEMIPATVTLWERLFGSAILHSAGWLGRHQPDGTYHFDLLGKLLGAGLLVWGAIWLSRFARFVLEEEFYPRMSLGAGVPYAISMSLHYVVLVLAFLGATAVLGIDMTKFTILVSALGVGVGFGLQNIINNFVSGLILLFERPVKVGDTILTGTDTGTVERIGIRASILRTPAGTEVIVPNGTLISSNVTNWTLSSRERIVAIPLNVVRGPDLAHVINLLTAAAATHPQVLKQPAPQVLAQGLGPNLALELRAWTGPDADWTQVRSEVVLAISAVLSAENIILA